jgi:hypothetical protein
MPITWFLLAAAVNLTSPRPEIATPEPTTPSARLLQALGQAEDDFADVKRELGLVGSAPLAGLKADDRPLVRPAAQHSEKGKVKKVSVKTRR